MLLCWVLLYQNKVLIVDVTVINITVLHWCENSHELLNNKHCQQEVNEKNSGSWTRMDILTFWKHIIFIQRPSYCILAVFIFHITFCNFLITHTFKLSYKITPYLPVLLVINIMYLLVLVEGAIISSAFGVSVCAFVVL